MLQHMGSSQNPFSYHIKRGNTLLTFDKKYDIIDVEGKKKPSVLSLFCFCD